MKNKVLAKVIIFDAEIKKAILGKKEDPVDGVEYCKSWGDFEGMGVSCVCTWDSTKSRNSVYLDDNLEKLQKDINAVEYVIGFNNYGFDNKLLAAHGVVIDEAKSIDILAEIMKVTKSRKGLGLDAICEANFGIKKSGNGALAPIKWQKGKHGEVIDYCINDVEMTRKVFEKILRDGFIVDPRDTTKKIQIDINL